jgi:wobble nucleotide-excising tRNase
MVKEIDIKKFGQFNNYEWVQQFGNSLSFKRLNIIYGRNYSGKTTLSRIFRCVEKKELHKHYCDAKFRFTLDDGSAITDNDIANYNGYRFRVFNSDFVRDNLSWLYNSDGTIEPFTILGESNVEIDNKIRNIDDQLGSIESAAGLLFQVEGKQKLVNEKSRLFRQKQTNFETSLQDRARTIKNNASVFLRPVYTITHLKSELQVVTDLNILTSAQKEEKMKLLKEDPKLDIPHLLDANPQLDNFFSLTKEIVERKVAPSKPIMELIQDSLLQTWVREGIDKHKGKRTTCAFCGNPISAELWEKLDAHFSKESEELRENIEQLKLKLTKSKTLVQSFINLKPEQFYVDIQASFTNLLSDWESQIDKYNSNIDILIEKLTMRNDDIFQNFQLELIENNSGDILELIRKFNEIISTNNLRTKTLADDQSAARADLLKSEVAEFKRTILYDDVVKQINSERSGLSQDEAAIVGLQAQIGQLAEERRALQALSMDESRGAELVNEYLSHFFGHQELRLIAFKEDERTKFKIQRDSIDANNLSEGECSLISFCYFIAKIQDELNAQTNNLVIYIDDPISSLDNNHTFFVFSLIETVIAKPKNYHQLFISTHNLDFLKYIKRLTKPGKGDSQTAYFLMQKRNKNNTILVKSPDYMNKYTTEFNYLFNEIYNCAFETEETIAEKHQYGFGNNVRKFLEAYLFFKYPDHSLGGNERLKLFFGTDVTSYSLVFRLYNEFSHLEEQFDRSITPIDIEEMKKVALVVLTKIRQSDEEQYKALCQSIGKDAATSIMAFESLN